MVTNTKYENPFINSHKIIVSAMSILCDVQVCAFSPLVLCPLLSLYFGCLYKAADVIIEDDDYSYITASN